MSHSSSSEDNWASNKIPMHSTTVGWVAEIYGIYHKNWSLHRRRDSSLCGMGFYPCIFFRINLQGYDRGGGVYRDTIVNSWSNFESIGSYQI